MIYSTKYEPIHSAVAVPGGMLSRFDFFKIRDRPFGFLVGKWLFFSNSLNWNFYGRYGVYVSQLIRFARVSSYITDFNTRNKLLTQKLLRYHKRHKPFLNFIDDTMI